MWAVMSPRIRPGISKMWSENSLGMMSGPGNWPPNTKKPA